MYEFKRSIPVNSDYQVIVVGGGPAGCAAAAAAAREGAKTLLIEGTAALGGMGTNGLVPFWCGFSNGGDLCSTGIGKTVLEALQEKMPLEEKGKKGGSIDAEALKRVYDDLVTGYGAEVLFHTVLSAVDTDDEGRVGAVIVSNKGGMKAYTADVFVDCTGDADLTAWAGGEFELGDELGEMQCATMCFTLTNVNMEEYAKIKTHRVIYPNGGKYPLIPDDHCVTAIVGPGAVGFNAGSLFGVDGTDPEDLSRTLIKGRKLVGQIVDCIKEELPEAYAEAHLDKTQALLGIREGRRIKGDYKLCQEDYHSRRVFPDEIARNCYNFDCHETPTEIAKIQRGEALPFKPEEFLYAPGESHGIPYRSLVPEKLKNVIVAGRCICAERRMQGTTRIMAACLATGEAAGMAAAHALAMDKVDMHKVDTDKLRARLKEVGAYIK
ncbi:MAG: FAD-dependent oxidoreductase [Ruminococcaceae bacterium]|nr:FAD-dependent oxidoreductase [Oscillospiraceae bacterium]